MISDDQFPREVHDSLAALRVQAKAARHRQDVRRATSDEIQLSELHRKPFHCAAHSARTGLACQGKRIAGGTVCVRHGGQLRQVRSKAEQRLLAAVDPVLAAMIGAATQTENLNAAVKAGQDLLDRAGVGSLVEAKVRSSLRGQSQTAVKVQIGWLEQMVPLDDSPPAILINKTQPDE